MLASPLPPSLLDTYSLWTSSLWCNALCILNCFLVLWSICLSSSPVNFKNGPSILREKQPRYLSLRQGYCYRVLSREIFWIFCDTLFYFFFRFQFFNGVSFQYSKFTYWPMTNQRRTCGAIWNNICRSLQELRQLEVVKARVRGSLQLVRALRWGLLPPAGRPPVDSVVVSEGRVKASLQSLTVFLQLSNPGREEVLSGPWR